MKLTAIAAAVIVAAGAATLGGAWYTGERIEQDLQAQLQQAQQQLAGQKVPGIEFNLELVGLQRSLFSSNARYLLQVTDTGKGETLELAVDDHIEHGPLPVSRLTSGKLAPVMAVNHFELVRNDDLEAWFKAAGDKVPLQGTVVTGYDGSFSGDVTAAALSITEDGNSLSSTPLTMQFEGRDQGRLVKGTGHMAQLQFKGTDQSGKAFSLTLENFSTDSDLARGEAGFYLGSNTLGVQAVKVLAPEDRQILLSDLRYQDKSREQDGFMDVQAGYSLGGVSYNGQKLGSAELSMQFNHMKTSVLQQLGEQIRQLQARAADGESSRALRRDLEEPLTQALQELLQHKPQIALSPLALRTEHGESVLTLDVALSNPGDVKRLPPEQLLQKLVEKLQLRLHIDKAMMRDAAMMQALVDPSVDRAMLEQSAGMMVEMASGMAVGTGMLKLEGERLSSSLDYADGMVDFNGQRMPLESFIMLMMQKSQGMPMP